jgi:signal transduction histidine kinase
MPERDVSNHCEYVARHLEAQARVLAEHWVQSVAERLDLPVERILPADDLLGHLPEVIEWVASCVRRPNEAVRPDIRDRLRLFAQYRREEGFSLAETLCELEELASILWEAFAEAVEADPHPPDPRELTECGGRLRRALALVTVTTHSLWLREEEDQRSDLASRLAEFARMVVHELKNPLHAIHLWSELLSGGSKTLAPDRIESYSASIQHAARRMSDLLDDIRVLAVAESAQSEERWALLRSLVEEVFGALSDSARSRGVECRIAEPMPAIHVDAVQVQIALANLIGNAIKYSDREKPTRWLEVRARPSDAPFRGWRIEVVDNGLGIPEGLQHKLFRRHFRAHPEVADGTGLGLAITRQVVEQRYGRVGFESVEGSGSTFFLIVPDRDVAIGDQHDSTAPLTKITDSVPTAS